MAPLEPWEKVLVKTEFLTSVHGKTSCISCHNGKQSPEKEIAHTGLVRNPTENPEKFCGGCHQKQTQNIKSSLHFSLQGYWTVLNVRSMPENKKPLETMFGNHCSKCHTTCADCHISQPNSVEGGFLDGHLFVKTPPMTRTCTGCHGSRVGNEYLGKNHVAPNSDEMYPGDVHFRVARMNCVSCHQGASLHDSGGATHRLYRPQNPKCENCHPKVGAAGDTVPQHALHKDKVSCQVCHSITYTSCDACHVSISPKTNQPVFRTEGTYMTFLIGKNPLKSPERPYNYVPVRHIPVAPNQFEYYGKNLLPNFNKLPTWAYATPHNIQRITPQSESCNNCHGETKIFLTKDKVKPEELEANKPVIVEKVPTKK